ncbi:hypothetical protein D9M71_479240 [compost metagenome]
MKNLVLPLVLALLAGLFIGYYDTRYAEDNKRVFFIKKQPTFQVEFENLFANDADNKKLPELNDEERKIVLNYCKYRLGIETNLKTQDELEMCKKR